MQRTKLILLLSLTLLTPVGHAQRQRCGSPEPEAMGGFRSPPSDCGYLTNTPQPEYTPSFFYNIPVVFHVIQNTAGDGFLSAATIQDQIDILNEDFQAIPGTPGAPGNNAKIRFHLAKTDPGGNPTTGITYVTNNSWYSDSGNYWNSQAWDTNRYLNIYTNAPPCCFGYVSGFASQGIAGQSNDRVVLWWEAVGRDPTAGWPLNMGRTATHEVGHYLGLYHTFCGGCGSAGACYSTGDLICDTNGESAATLGCPGSKNSCGNADPFHNYMDYTDDPCLWEFTPEQVNRMRCTLQHWRPDVFRTSPTHVLPTAGVPGFGGTVAVPASADGTGPGVHAPTLQLRGTADAPSLRITYGRGGVAAILWTGARRVRDGGSWRVFPALSQRALVLDGRPGSPSGSLEVPLPPTSPALLGASLFAQVAVLDRETTRGVALSPVLVLEP